jgi:hypothetical protein
MFQGRTRKIFLAVFFILPVVLLAYWSPLNEFSNKFANYLGILEVYTTRPVPAPVVQAQLIASIPVPIIHQAYSHCKLNLSTGAILNKSHAYERIPIIYGRTLIAKGDFTWLDQLDKNVYTPVKYVMSLKPCNATDRYCIYPNSGKEVGSYLKYVILQL